MEKLKSILSPGKATDDEIMYGSGRSNDPVHSGNTGTLTGEGSHFDNSRDTPSGPGLGSSNIGSDSTTAGPHSSNLANKVDPRVDSDLDGSQTVGNTTGAYGSTGRSSMPGAFEPDSNPYTTQDLDPRLGGPTTTSGTASSTAGTGYNTTAQDGLTGQNTARGTDRHLGRDAAVAGTAGVVGEGVHRHRENERENLASSTTTPATYSDNSGIGNSSSTTGMQPHSSSLLNKLDPRVNSNTSETARTTESGPHYGRDAAAVGTAGAVGEGIHHHRENERQNIAASSATPATYSDNSGIGNSSSTTGAQPHSSSLLNKLDPRVDSNTSGTTRTTESGPHYGRDAAAVGTAGAVAEGIHHHRENERENLGSSAYPGTTPSGTGSAYYGGPAGVAVTDTSGPHVTSTANRLDPAINTSGRPIENAAQHDPMSGGGGLAADEAHRNNKHHLGRDAAIGAGGVGLAEHEHRKHERESEIGVGNTTGVGSNTGNYGDNSTSGTTTGTAGTGTTTGPHSSSLLNKLDPRVRSSNTGTEDNTGSTHHYGRDAAVGAGGVGLAEHEHRKHERERDTGVGNTVPSSNTGVGSNTGTYGDNAAYTSTTGNAGHHYGRDAAVGAGGVGLAEHERRKHERERDTGAGTGTGSGAALGSNTMSTGTTGTTDHPYDREGTVGAGGIDLAEHERLKHAALGPNTINYSNEPLPTETVGNADHYGRDAAVGTGGVGLAEHERRKHELERDTGAGTGTGTDAALGTNTTSAGTTGTTDHHYGRDAAVGAGGVGLVEHERRKHERERDSGAVNSAVPGSNTTSTGTSGATGHHYGRDAAIGAGGVGLAEHEHRKHERERDAGAGTGAALGTNTNYPNEPSSTGVTGATDRPYDRDGAVGAGGIDLAEHERLKHAALGPNTINYSNEPLPGENTGNTDHHYGRDAAIGAGGVGLAEHEHQKNERDSGVVGSTGTTAASGIGTGPAPNTSGPHSQDWKNKLDPRVNANPNTTNTGLNDTRDTTHGGRDAVAGAGLLGAGYEAEKHHTARKEPGYQTATSGATNNQSSYDPSYNSTNTGPMDQQSRDHHLGRDAAAAGVVGGAAYEAEKHHTRDKDLTTAEKEQKRELKREEKEAKYEQKEEKKHHGLLSFLHRDKNKKYTKEEEEEFDRQEREDSSHAGRGAAFAGTAVGGGAYEAEKHHGHQNETSGDLDTMKPLPVAPGNHGIGTGEGTQNALMMERKRGEGYDTDPATGAQSLAAGSDAYPPPGTSLGDKLHGVERNRGVNDGMTGAGYNTSSGTTGTGTMERETGVGSSGIGYGSSDPTSDMSGVDRSAGYTGSTAAKPHLLHKDPPANHPAARAMAGEGNNTGYPTDTTSTGDNY